MTFLKTLWTDRSAPKITAAQLNRLEQGIADAHGGAAIPFVTALPAGPVDGQQVYFVADAAKGVVWTLKYRAADPSAYKWQVVGGAPLEDQVDATETSAATGYVGFASVGPSVTLPLAGDYDVHIEFFAYGGGVQSTPHMSYDIGAAAATDTECAQMNVGGASNAAQGVLRERRLTGLAAGIALVSKYRTSVAQPYNISARLLRAMPVRVG